jgi:hypothetical protein
MKKLLASLGVVMCLATASQAAPTDPGVFKGQLTVFSRTGSVCGLFNIGDTYDMFYFPRIAPSTAPESLTLIGSDRAFTATVTSAGGVFDGNGSAAGTAILLNLALPVTFDFKGLARTPGNVTDTTKVISVLGKITNFVGLDCTVTFRSSGVRSKIESVLGPLKHQ